MMQSYQISQVQKFKGGLVSGSFIKQNGKPIKITLRNVIAPLGISEYYGKLSMILNIEDINDPAVRELFDIQAIMKEHPDLEGKEIKYVINHTEKYGNQIKINFNEESRFYDSNKKKSSSQLFTKRCLVDVLLTINMIWIKGSECGISLKCSQIRHIENVRYDNNNVIEECLL